MGKYNEFLYGDGTKYGHVADSTHHPRWALQIKWDGTYTLSSNEMPWATAMHVRRGRENYITGDGGGFSNIGVGTASIILDNEDGRYDPLNTNSPLYPYVRPGKFCRLWFRDGATVGDDYQVMRGIIDNIIPIRDRGGSSVRLEIVDGIQWLRNRVATWNLEGPYKLINFITLILLAAGWPQDEWGITVSTGGATVKQVWAWRDLALPLIQEVMEAEVGLWFQNRQGYSITRARNFAQSSVATLSEADLLRNIVVRYGWESVRNHVQIYTYTLKTVAGGTIWDLDDTEVSIGAGEEKIFWAEFEYQGQRVAGDSSSFSYSFEVNTQSDGLGADLTSQCSLGVSNVGGGARVQVVNNSASTGYFIQLAIDGDVYINRAPTIIEASDSASQSSYGQRTLTLNSIWQQRLFHAEAIATGLLAQLKDPMALPIIQIEDQLLIQYGLDVFDRVTLSLPTVGVSGDFRVGAIEHEWTGNSGEQSRTTLTFEPYFTLDIS